MNDGLPEPEVVLNQDYQYSPRHFALPDCVLCKGRGMINHSKEGEPFDWQECICVDRRKLAVAINVRLDLVFEDQHRRMTLATWKTGGEVENEEALKHARTFLENFELAQAERWTIGFWGEQNAGKSHLAVALAQAITKKYNVNPFYVNVTELLEQQKMSFSNKDRDALALPLYRAKHADILVIDDLGAEYQRTAIDEESVSWVEEIFYQIFEARTASNRPTIYTTNLKPSALPRRLGKRVWTRIERSQVRPPIEILQVPGENRISEASRAMFE